MDNKNQAINTAGKKPGTDFIKLLIGIVIVIVVLIVLKYIVGALGII